MKFTCTNSNLKAALSTVAPAIPKGGYMNHGLLLKCEDGFLHLTANNLEMVIQTEIGCAIEEVGSILLRVAEANKLIGLVKTFDKDGVCRMELDGDRMEVTYGGDSYVRFDYGSADEMPVTPVINEIEAEFLVDGEMFQEVLKNVVFCASATSDRPILASVHLDITGKEFNAVASDGYRLAIQEGKRFLDGEAEIPMSLLIPAPIVKHIIRLCPDDHVYLTIGNDSRGKLLKVHSPTDISANLTCYLMSGHYPEYRNYIPTSHKTQVEVASKRLAAQIKTAGAIYEDTSSTVFRLEILAMGRQRSLLAYGGDANSDNHTRFDSEIPLMKYEGKQNRIAVSFRFISEAVRGSHGNAVIALNKAESPIVIKDTAYPGWQNVIMPMFAEWGTPSPDDFDNLESSDEDDDEIDTTAVDHVNTPDDPDPEPEYTDGETEDEDEDDYRIVDILDDELVDADFAYTGD